MKLDDSKKTDMFDFNGRERLIKKLKNRKIIEKLEAYDKIEFKRKGLVFHLKQFDVNSKDEIAVTKTKIIGEVLNEISDENDQKLLKMFEKQA